MEDFDKNMLTLLRTSDITRKKVQKLSIKGNNCWDMKISLNWKGIGEINIFPISLHDLWALKDWYQSLTFRSRYLYSIFPIDKSLEKNIARHIKRNDEHEDVTFNAWLGDEIIGHFLIGEISGKKPLVYVGISDRFQKKGLGSFFIQVMISIFKSMGHKELYLTTMHENDIAFNLYKSLGFKFIRNIKLPVPGYDYSTDEYEMKIDLDRVSFKK
jgi:ribosomal protein S18 acetylase RimI-like enzyme